jgi:hypothetical protein
MDVWVKFGLLLFIFSGCAYNNERTVKSDVNKKNDSKVVFNQVLHDFGNINQNEEVGAFFWAKNVSQTPWIVKSVDVGCDCTTVHYSQEPIQPGDSSRIDVFFNSNGLYGVQIKTITIFDNSIEGKHDLVFKANVIASN